MSRNDLARWVRTGLLGSMTMAWVVLSAQGEAVAGATITSGTACVPYIGAPGSSPNQPLVFPYGSRLELHRIGSASAYNVLISCPVDSIAGPEIASDKITVAIVDGDGFNSVRLCFGAYYTDSFSCGDAVTSSGPTYFVAPPATKPSGANTPFFLISATVSSSNSRVVVRSTTTYWTNP